MQTTTVKRASTRSRRVAIRLAALVVGVSALAQAVPGRAASPSSADVFIGEPGNATASWTGGPLTGNPDPLGPPSPAPCSSAAGCDRETVTINAPAGYTSTKVISLAATVATDPSSTPGTSTWDIAIVDSGGNAIAASGAGTNPDSVTASDVQPGVYTVEVDGDIATGDTYQASATVSSADRVAEQTHPTGTLSFGREVVSDPFRLGTEPTVQTATDGTIYEGPIFGFSTTQSFLSRSDDQGRTFNTLGVPGVGKLTTCGGGGDEDIATDQYPGDLFFEDLGGEPSVPAAVTNDHGNTTPFGTPGTGAEDCTANDQNGPQYFPDRQWLSTDYVNGLEWYIYRDGLISEGTPTDQFSGHPIYGEYIKHAPLPTAAGTAGTANITQTSLCTGTGGIDAPCVSDVAIAGNAVTDNYGPNKGDSYVAETTKNGVGVIRFNPTGFTEQTAVAGASVVLFPTVAVDKAGTVYETYTDASTYQLMFTYSTSQGTTGTWSTPVALNGAPAAVTVMPWIVAGDDGRVDVVFYGSPLSQPPTTNSGPWNAYMLQSLAANTATPNWTQQVMTDRPNHIEPVCLSGLGCTTNTGPGGDRELGDFFRVALDPSGRAVVSFADGNNQLGQENAGGNQPTAAPSFADFVQQASGPSLYGTGAVSPIPVDTNTVTVTAHNNHIPFSSPTGQGPSDAALELLHSNTSVTTDASNITNVNITVNVANLDPTVATTAPGLPTATYLTRWWFNGQIYYGAAEYNAATQKWSYFSGQVAPVSDGAAIKYAYYPASNSPTGTVTPGADGTIQLTIPASQVGNPTPDDTLYSVTSYALTHAAPTLPAPPSVANFTDFPQVADSLPAYNVIPQAATNVPEAKGAGLLLAVGIVGIAVAVLPWRRRRRRLA